MRPRQAAGPGRGAASSRATGFTPHASNSQASCMFSGPLPAISTRSPGQTRCARTRVCRPPVVITPGRVQPGRGTGRSCAPVASTSRRGVRVTARPPINAPISFGANAPQTDASVSIRAPAAIARSRSIVPKRNCLSGAGSVWLSASALAYCPPVLARSSSSSTEAPASAPAAAADRPAGPPPTTSMSQLSEVASAPEGTGESGAGSAEGPPVTIMPSATLVMHARWPMRPSTVTTQS